MIKRKEKEQVRKVTGKGFAKDMLVLLGAGLAAGLALVATADKVCTKAFDHYEDEVEFDD